MEVKVKTEKSGTVSEDAIEVLAEIAWGEILKERSENVKNFD